MMGGLLCVIAMILGNAFYILALYSQSSKNSKKHETTKSYTCQAHLLTLPHSFAFTFVINKNKSGVGNLGHTVCQEGGEFRTHI